MLFYSSSVSVPWNKVSMSDSSWYPSKVPVPAQVMETMNKMKLWGKGTYNNVIIYTYYILIILYYIICIYYIYIDPFLPWCHTSIKSGPKSAAKAAVLHSALGSGALRASHHHRQSATQRKSAAWWQWNHESIGCCWAVNVVGYLV